MARPGGGAHGRRHRPPERLPLHLPMAIVLLISGLGLAWMMAEHWRQGTGLIGASLLVAGVSRALLPDDRAGLLAVRSQGMDVLCYLGLGVLVVVLASTVPRSPFILG
ncbi:MAG TPA: DUF3017 domain-containing protein [Pseudonocardia sp.]|jgi:hypothetical protein